MRSISHVGIYLRLSMEKRGKLAGSESLDNHREILTDFAKERRWTWDEYAEVLSGGASEMENRPELQRLLDNIEKYDAILVIELSRISRNGLISQTVKQVCIDYEILIVTPLQTYDLTNNENDRLLYDFASMISSHEHGIIGKRSKANKIQMAKQGLHVTGGTPYGYRRNPETKRLEICEPEASTVRLIFKLHEEGLGSRKIVDILNVEGHKPQRAKAWNEPSVKRIIKNPVYKGNVTLNDRKKVKKGGKSTYKIENTIIVENAHPFIIYPDQWERANLTREERAEQFRVREKPSKHVKSILKDLVFCGLCGRKSSFSKERNGKIVIRPCQFLLANSSTRCRNCGMIVDDLENEVLKKLRLHYEACKEELAKLRDNDTSSLEREIKERIKSVVNQLKVNANRQKNLLDQSLDGIFSREELQEKKQELLNEQSYLERTRNQLQEQLENVDPSQKVRELEFLVNVLENLDTYSIEGKNNVLKKIIKKIRYSRDIPPEIRKLSTRNPARKEYPFYYEIEYF